MLATDTHCFLDNPLTAEAGRSLHLYQELSAMIEVEYKYVVKSIESLQADLNRLNAQFLEKVQQDDIYFNHVHDNFKQKDIALRLRECRSTTGSMAWLTYKGPNQDAVGKIREEHEVRLSDDGAAETLQKIFAGVGFQPVAPVRKTRDRYQLTVADSLVEFCLDQVEGLGAFAEIEILVPDQSQVDQAKAAIKKLSDQLGLSKPIRKSYLDLLLKKQTHSR